MAGELVGMAQNLKSPPSLLFSVGEKATTGASGRNGSGEGTTGCGWRRKGKGKGRRR